MFSKLTTKLALRKVGLPSNALSIPDYPGTNTNGKNGKDGTTALPFANPFKDMTIPPSLISWKTPAPAPIKVVDTPILGTRAPSSSGGKLRLPGVDGRGTVVLFLRHTGCPFAEKSFLELRRLANKYPSIHFIAISHASKSATDKWISALGGAWAITVVIDEEREVYASWGLGVSTTYHLLNPWTQIAARKLGNQEGIWGREVDQSANRWVVGGSWACDGMGSVRWGAANKTADDIPDLVQACEVLGMKS